MKHEFIPFAADANTKDFVIFLVKRENDLNAYVWVMVDDDEDFEQDIRITPIWGLSSFCNQRNEPLYFGEIPDPMVEKAFKRLDDCPKEIIQKKLDKFNRHMDSRSDDEDVDIDYKYEDGILKDIQESVEKGEETRYV